MTKNEFISAAKTELKNRGFRKNGQYWYRNQADYLECIFVQGSQWDKDNYYVEIGFAEGTPEKRSPTLLHWIASHRCRGKQGDRNIELAEVFRDIETFFRQFSSKAALMEYLHAICHLKFSERLIW